MTALAFHRATLGYRDRAVLTGIDVAIEDGEFVGVLGPNGAGKTTLMRAVLGLVPLAAGTLDVLGRSPTRGHPGIGYMPQVRAAPTARLGGRDVVASALSGHRWGLPWPGRAGAAEVAAVLDLVEATDLADRPLAELSGGERQRLLLAQALMGSPRLLLLDEPLLGLDPRRQAEVVALVRRLQQRLGFAVLFSAHDLNPLLPALDRVLYLGRGEAALGTVAEIVTAPVLSRLYGTRMEVVHAAGRILVLAEDGVHAEVADACL